MEIKLNGKVALVTGSSKGIGRAIALRLAKSGADVAVNYNTNMELAEEVCKKIREMGRGSVAIQADVSDSKKVNQMVEIVTDSFDGRLDIAICNAGTNLWKEFIDVADEERDLVLDTNLNGTFNTARAASKKMVENGVGGKIIGIASGAGHGGRYGQAAYCASKAGIRLLCKSIAIDLAPYGINVNSISVGYVEVGKMDTPEKEIIKESILPRILLRRHGEPVDIANMVTFLVSDKASWITGADFRVDGGESAGRVPFTNASLE
jgi:NAD(P)-dependent dehydrogenase (short-subunit alcohol dehydrogenase family)